MTSSGVVAKRDEVKIQKVDIKLRPVDLFSLILISIDCTPFVERATYLHPCSCPHVNREYTATPILLFSMQITQRKSQNISRIVH
jgi:hypothetical protein